MPGTMPLPLGKIPSNANAIMFLHLYLLGGGSDHKCVIFAESVMIFLGTADTQRQYIYTLQMLVM